MINKPMDVLELFPVRKTKKQKQAFRDAVTQYAQKLGYTVEIEQCGSAHNVIMGDPVNAKYLITAHYDTPAGMIFPNLITPCNWVTFLLYQTAIIALFAAVAIGAGVIAGLLVNHEDTVKTTSLLVYWGMLALMLLGPANKNNANDNTSGVVTVLETAGSMPDHLRHQVCFVLFDLEEAGLVGSAGYRKKHKKEIDNQMILNCDCVGDGNELMMFPTKKLKKNEEMIATLRSVCGAEGEKSMALRENGFAYYPSDQRNFPYGVGIAAFRRSSWAGLYCDKIHTAKDTVLDENNVIFLRDCLIRLISNAAE